MALSTSACVGTTGFGVSSVGDTTGTKEDDDAGTSPVVGDATAGGNSDPDVSVGDVIAAAGSECCSTTTVGASSVGDFAGVPGADDDVGATAGSAAVNGVTATVIAASTVNDAAPISVVGLFTGLCGCEEVAPASLANK